jgi:amino acid transporter
MSSQYKLSLPAAILININIMLGSGIFINLLQLSKATGILSAFVYAIVGLLMFPIVLAIAKLLQKYPGGSFYTFGSKEINSFFGFLATWIYFIGKLASATLLIHFFTLIIQSLIPIFSNINTLLLDAIIVSFFSYLNMQNLKVGSIVQYAFIIFKAIPILFIILSGIFLLNPGNLSSEFMLWQGVLPIVPFIVFAFAGFEAAASLSRHIKNPDRNAPLAVLISFAIVVFICVLSNFLFYMVLGDEVWNAVSYFEAFPLLLQKVFPVQEFIRLRLTSILQMAIACSALGGAYGILFSNSWNLYRKEN